MTGRGRAAATGVLAALLAASAAGAQDQAPQVTVTLVPDGPVTVGTPVEVTATVLVPTFMPAPPGWPDLQIADAVTRLPERATRPVTGRVGGDTWSGVARRWEIIPQRAGDYDLGAPEVTVTFADAGSSAPTTVSVAFPDISFPATVPAGGEAIDPFVAAADLSVVATVDGLPAAPKPGDALTLTLTTTADGPPAILLPPLAGSIVTPDGLRAYPREPVLADGPPATRTEAVTYVVERPGTYVLPGLAVGWWNTGDARAETATTEPVSFSVAGSAVARGGEGDRRLLVRAGLLAAVVVAGIAVVFAVWRSRHRSPRTPTEAELYRAVRRAARRAPPAEIRQHLVAWTAHRSGPPGPSPAVDTALRALERSVYGPPGPPGPAGSRRSLLSGLAAMRYEAPTGPGPALPPLNPATGAEGVPARAF